MKFDGGFKLGILFFGMLVLGGCGRDKYAATTVVLVQHDDGGSCSAAFMESQASVIMELSVPMLAGGASVSVSGCDRTGIVRISVTSTDAAKAADICNRLAKAYISRTEEGIKKIVIEEASAPSRPL